MERQHENSPKQEQSVGKLAGSSSSVDDDDDDHDAVHPHCPPHFAGDLFGACLPRTQEAIPCADFRRVAVLAANLEDGTEPCKPFPSPLHSHGGDPNATPLHYNIRRSGNQAHNQHLARAVN